MNAAITKKLPSWAHLGINAEFDPLLRLPDVLAVVPVSKATWWNGIKEGRFPPGLKLGPKTTCWKGSDIAALIAGLTTAPQQPAIERLGTSGEHVQLTSATDESDRSGFLSVHPKRNPGPVKKKVTRQCTSGNEEAE
jgi:prophage regulatory protein